MVSAPAIVAHRANPISAAVRTRRVWRRDVGSIRWARAAKRLGLTLPGRFGYAL
jgi:hypothetical protein